MSSAKKWEQCRLPPWKLDENFSIALHSLVQSRFVSRHVEDHVSRLSLDAYWSAIRSPCNSIPQSDIPWRRRTRRTARDWPVPKRGRPQFPFPTSVVVQSMWIEFKKKRTRFFCYCRRWRRATCGPWTGRRSGGSFWRRPSRSAKCTRRCWKRCPSCARWRSVSAHLHTVWPHLHVVRATGHRAAAASFQNGPLASISKWIYKKKILSHLHKRLLVPGPSLICMSRNPHHDGHCWWDWNFKKKKSTRSLWFPGEWNQFEAITKKRNRRSNMVSSPALAAILLHFSWKIRLSSWG